MTTRQARLARLRALFVHDALAEQAEIERLAGAGPAGDPARLRKLVHDLRGSGGSYGFPAITAAAAALEAALKEGDAPAALLPLAAALGAAVQAARSSLEPAGGA